MIKKTELTEFVLSYLTNSCETETKLSICSSWVLFSKEENDTSLDFKTYEPVICIIVQGEKEVISSEEVICVTVGQTIIITHDIHLQARIKVNEINEPYVAIIIPIDVEKLRKIAVKMSFQGKVEQNLTAINVGNTSYDLEEAVLRYLKLLNRPQEVNVLATSILREIYFRVLTSESGSMLREILIEDSHADRIHRAVTYIKSNYRSDISIDDLIKLVGMSSSSFHTHFKRITKTTPKKNATRFKINGSKRSFACYQRNCFYTRI